MLNVVDLAWRRLCRALPPRYTIHITRREDRTLAYKIPLSLPPTPEVVAAVLEDAQRVVDSLQVLHSKLTDAPADKTL